MESSAIQYVTTSDGISLAYAVAGEGEPAIHLPYHHNEVVQRGNSWSYRLMAEAFRFLHYDSRGQGC